MPYNLSILTSPTNSLLFNSSFPTSIHPDIAHNITRPYPLISILIASSITVMVLLAVIGNAAVIIAICGYRRMRTFTNMLLMSLATADMLVGALIMPPAMLYLVRAKWEFGRLACAIWSTLDVLLCTASILSLCVISLDRYVAILWPLKYIQRRNKRLAGWLVASVWALAVTICIPPWLVPTWGFAPDPDHCGYVLVLSYRIYSAFGSFYLPLFVMLFVYYKIFQVASNRERMFAETSSLSGAVTGGTLLAGGNTSVSKGVPMSVSTNIPAAAPTTSLFAGLRRKSSMPVFRRFFSETAIQRLPTRKKSSMKSRTNVPRDASRVQPDLSTMTFCSHTGADFVSISLRGLATSPESPKLCSDTVRQTGPYRNENGVNSRSSVQIHSPPVRKSSAGPPVKPILRPNRRSLKLSNLERTSTTHIPLIVKTSAGLSEAGCEPTVALDFNDGLLATPSALAIDARSFSATMRRNYSTATSVSALYSIEECSPCGSIEHFPTDMNQEEKTPSERKLPAKQNFGYVKYYSAEGAEKGAAARYNSKFIRNNRSDTIENFDGIEFEAKAEKEKVDFKKLVKGISGKTYVVNRRRSDAVTSAQPGLHRDIQSTDEILLRVQNTSTESNPTFQSRPPASNSNLNQKSNKDIVEDPVNTAHSSTNIDKGPEANGYLQNQNSTAYSPNSGPNTGFTNKKFEQTTVLQHNSTLMTTISDEKSIEYNKFANEIETSKISLLSPTELDVSERRKQYRERCVRINSPSDPWVLRVDCSQTDEPTSSSKLLNCKTDLEPVWLPNDGHGCHSFPDATDGPPFGCNGRTDGRTTDSLHYLLLTDQNEDSAKTRTKKCSSLNFENKIACEKTNSLSNEAGYKLAGTDVSTNEKPASGENQTVHEKEARNEDYKVSTNTDYKQETGTKGATKFDNHLDTEHATFLHQNFHIKCDKAPSLSKTAKCHSYDDGTSELIASSASRKHPSVGSRLLATVESTETESCLTSSGVVANACLRPDPTAEADNQAFTPSRNPSTALSKKLVESFDSEPGSSLGHGTSVYGDMSTYQGDHSLGTASPGRQRSGKSGTKIEPAHLMLQAKKCHLYNAPLRRKKEKTIYMRERKALKTIGIIVAGFIISWLPFFALYLLQSACPVSCQVPIFVETTFLWLGYSNSVINPLIYTCYNTSFRRCFKEIFTCAFLNKRRKLLSLHKRR